MPIKVSPLRPSIPYCRDVREVSVEPLIDAERLCFFCCFFFFQDFLHFDFLHLGLVTQFQAQRGGFREILFSV